jgi:Ca-activated chloride channel family protein
MKSWITPLLLLTPLPALAGPQLTLRAEVGTPVVLSGGSRTAYLKVGLTGFELPDSRSRAPVNLAIVLDRSSSMSGEKIQRAKEAAIMVVDRLRDDDIVAVVSYDSVVEVLVPATRASEREHIRNKIRALDARGMTALFAGVSKGAQELRKFLSGDHVNRVILLSDGQANVGPASPNELGHLGMTLAKEGISVTTLGLGLGYNEDLMSQLAMKSDGNHAFVAEAAELARVFDAELGDVLAVVAQEVTVKVQVPAGMRPVRVLGREAEIRGQTTIVALNQLYARQERHFLLEVEIPPGAPGVSRDLATVDVSYANMLTKTTDRLSTLVTVAYAGTLAEVEARTNKDVMVAAVEAIANEQSRVAVVLRDEGKVQQAQKVLLDNAAYLDQNATRYASPKLKNYSNLNSVDAEDIAESDKWSSTRKKMRKTQHEVSTQQRY